MLVSKMATLNRTEEFPSQSPHPFPQRLDPDHLSRCDNHCVAGQSLGWSEYSFDST